MVGNVAQWSSSKAWTFSYTPSTPQFSETHKSHKFNFPFLTFECHRRCYGPLIIYGMGELAGIVRYHSLLFMGWES